MVVTHFVESHDSIKSDLPIKNVRLEGHALKGFTSSQFFPSDAAHPSKVSAKNRRLELEESPRDGRAISQQGRCTIVDRSNKTNRRRRCTTFRDTSIDEDFSDDRSRDTAINFFLASRSTHFLWQSFYINIFSDHFLTKSFSSWMSIGFPYKSLISFYGFSFSINCTS